MNPKLKTLYPLFLLISLGCAWGTSFSIARFALQNGITPLGYLFWQTLGPTVVMFFFLVLLKKKITPFNFEHIIFYFVAGLLGILLPNYFMYRAALHVSSGFLGLIVNTSPLFTYFFSILFFIEKFDFKRFLGILIGFSGLFYLFWPKLSLNYGNNFWLIFSFIIPIFLSFCTIYIVKFKQKNINSLELAFGMLLAATFIIFPITLFENEFHSIASMTLPNFIIVLEIFLSSIGYILFFELLKISGPVYYSLVACIVALAGLFWGYVVFGELIMFNQIISVFCTVLAIYLVGNNKNKN